MKMLPLFAITLALAGPLAGCTSPGHVSETEYTPTEGGPGYGPVGPAADVNAVPGARPAAGTSGATGAAATGSGQQAMCDLQRRMAAARSAEERQAMMDEAMAGMSPDMRDQQLRMMRQQCQ
jgi:hypothetical protein